MFAQWFQQRQFVFPGQALGRQFGVAEVAGAAGVGAMEQAPVGPFEVEQQGDRLAHANVLKIRLAQIEDEALHALGVLVGDLFLDDATFTQRRAVIAGGPVLGAELQVEIQLAGLECFQGDAGVAVVIHYHPIEVVETLAYRQLGRPVIANPLKANRATGAHLANAVGAAAQRWFQSIAGEIPLGPEMFRQHRQLAQDHRQFAVVAVVEVEGHAALGVGHHLFHIGVIGLIERGALFYQGVEGEYHVGRGDRLAVMKARLGAQMEAHPGIVRRLFDTFGQQTIFGKGLVHRLYGESVIDQAELLGRRAPADEAVEGIEAAKPRQPQGAALGRLRIDVVEVGKVFGVFRRLAVEGQCMAAGRREGERRCCQQQASQTGFHGIEHRGGLPVQSVLLSIHQLRMDNE